MCFLPVTKGFHLSGFFPPNPRPTGNSPPPPPPPTPQAPQPHSSVIHPSIDQCNVLSLSLMSCSNRNILYQRQTGSAQTKVRNYVYLRIKKQINQPWKYVESQRWEMWISRKNKFLLPSLADLIDRVVITHKNKARCEIMFLAKILEIKDFFSILYINKKKITKKNKHM